jgi:hypothetical protein
MEQVIACQSGFAGVLTKYGSQAAIAMARQSNIGWPPSKKFCSACAPWPWQRLPQNGSEVGQRLNAPGGGRTELQIAFRTLLSVLVSSLVQIVDGEAPPGCPACGRQMRHLANFEICECRECRLFVNEKVTESDVNNVNTSSLEHSSRVDNAA